MGLVSTWMGDRLGTPDAVGVLFFIFHFKPIYIFHTLLTLTFDRNSSIIFSIQPSQLTHCSHSMEFVHLTTQVMFSPSLCVENTSNV